MKRVLCGILVSFCLFLPLLPGARAAAWTSAADVVSTALSQLDVEEGPRGESPYGQWYGIPRGHWCDMFVSWCAGQAGVPEEVFPWSAGCTAHAAMFEEMGRYQPSAARGGGYVPRQGDAIFFYDPEKYPEGKVVRHVGIVLWVERDRVFTVEGNTLMPRRDRAPEGQALPPCDASLLPRDYVAVKDYPLTDPEIHGYAVPAYDSRDLLPHEGWVDLGRYEPLREIFEALDQADILPGTSAYTYSPRAGMTRGEFLTLLMDLYGLSGWKEDTEPFPDVPEDSPCYGAVMTARSAGIVSGTASGDFCPDTYVSGSAAQAVISRTLAYAGQEDRQFSFTQGDLSSRGTPYTIRADIAAAVYELHAAMAVPAEAKKAVTLNGRRISGPVLQVDGGLYGPLETLRKQFPGLEVESGGETEEAGTAPVPMGRGDRVVMSRMSLRKRSRTGTAASFWYRGERYVALEPAAELLGAVLR